MRILGPCAALALLAAVPARGEPAATVVSRVGTVDPRVAAQAKLEQGDSFAAAGDTRLALFAYQDAVNLDPRSAEARMRLAALYARMGRLEQAIDQWNFALALDPSLAEARRSAASARAALEGRARPAGEAPGPRIYKLTPEPEPGPVPQAPPEPPRGP
jgi:tetratricopeptide (TPR) repeat protein